VAPARQVVMVSWGLIKCVVNRHDMQMQVSDIRCSRKVILELRRNREVGGFPFRSFNSESSGGSERGLDLAVNGLPRGLASCVEGAVVLNRDDFPASSSDFCTPSHVTDCDIDGEFRPRSQ
jgi:hypothetical protein